MLTIGGRALGYSGCDFPRPLTDRGDQQTFISTALLSGGGRRALSPFLWIGKLRYRAVQPLFQASSLLNVRRSVLLGVGAPRLLSLPGEPEVAPYFRPHGPLPGLRAGPGAQGRAVSCDPSCRFPTGHCVESPHFPSPFPILRRHFSPGLTGNNSLCLPSLICWRALKGSKSMPISQVLEGACRSQEGGWAPLPLAN